MDFGRGRKQREPGAVRARGRVPKLPQCHASFPFQPSPAHASVSARHRVTVTAPRSPWVLAPTLRERPRPVSAFSVCTSARHSGWSQDAPLQRGPRGLTPPPAGSWGAQIPPKRECLPWENVSRLLWCSFLSPLEGNEENLWVAQTCVLKLRIKVNSG